MAAVWGAVHLSIFVILPCSAYTQSFLLNFQCIDKSRDILDTELTAMAGESYDRAYGVGVFCCLMLLLYIVPDKKGYNFPYLIFHKNLCCDPSLEPSRQDGSIEWSQHTFLLRNKKNYI